MSYEYRGYCAKYQLFADVTIASICKSDYFIIIDITILYVYKIIINIK